MSNAVIMTFCGNDNAHLDFLSFEKFGIFESLAVSVGQVFLCRYPFLFTSKISQHLMDFQDKLYRSSGPPENESQWFCWYPDYLKGATIKLTLLVLNEMSQQLFSGCRESWCRSEFILMTFNNPLTFHHQLNFEFYFNILVYDQTPAKLLTFPPVPAVKPFYISLLST